MKAESIIKNLALVPLEGEGGFFRETYRGAESSAIYYLVTPGSCSKLHRLKSDEIYHFYSGSPVTMLQLRPNGKAEVLTLGNDLERGQSPQAVVPAGTWQGSFIESGDYALMGTTMAPGYDPAGFEKGDAGKLASEYPNHTEMIKKLA